MPVWGESEGPEVSGIPNARVTSPWRKGERDMRGQTSSRIRRIVENEIMWFCSCCVHGKEQIGLRSCDMRAVTQRI